MISFEPSFSPSCSFSVSGADMSGSVQGSCGLDVKWPLTELRLHIALPLLPCISFPILEGLGKGLVPFHWLGLKPERGLRCQRNGCGAVTHMALWGSSF